ncbi:MAG: PAS domain-containing protein [Notoacmeibacter sp.]|nr:PAS domain-containing protein [Notoacmeibacter sp.]
MKLRLPSPIKGLPAARAAGMALALLAVLGAFVWPSVAPALAGALAVMSIWLLAGMARNPGNSTFTRPSAKPVSGSPGEEPLAVLDALADPVILFNRKGDILYANRQAMRIFGRLAAGSDIRLVFRSPRMLALVEQVMLTGEAKAEEVVFRSPVEHVFDVQMTATGGQGARCVCVFSDRSELRRIERMRSDFIANASHELRTPLASISGFIETLEGPAAGDKAATARFLSIMKSQADRMARLIDDLLSLSRLEMNASARRDDTIDMADLAQSVISSLAGVAADNDVAVERNWEPGDWWVTGNRDELYQVLENLVSNACKYGADGKRVIVRLERSVLSGKAAVRTTVEDFGAGIPKEHVSRITERFYRVEQGRAQTHKGTGLGLAIVKHIVTLHKGRLSIVSDVGKGACFSFLLQAAGNGSARDAVAGRNSGTASGQDISRETAGMMPGGQ